VDTEIKDESID